MAISPPSPGRVTAMPPVSGLRVANLGDRLFQGLCTLSAGWVIVLFVLFAGLEVGHLWGVLFAAPLTALAVVTLVQLYRFWQHHRSDEITAATPAPGAP